MSGSHLPATSPDLAHLLSDLTPLPRHVEVGGGRGSFTGEVVERPLSGESAESEAYAVRVEVSDGEARIALEAASARGLSYARSTVESLRFAPGASLPELAIADCPALAWRGTIEGFYGTPWSHAARLDHLRFCAARRLNSYAYAPKDDEFHRARWRDLYPAAELARIGELVDLAESLHVRFTYTIAPGLSMVYSSAADREALLRKAEQLWSIGVRSFGILFDDIPMTLQNADDLAAFGPDEADLGRAQGLVCAEFDERFLRPRGADRLVTVPTKYEGNSASAYRSALAATLPADALVWWTGSDIVVGAVTRADIDEAAAAFDRDLLLWDNFPVNDFDFPRVFLGPLVGRTTDVAGSRLVGISANPMVHPTASQLALSTVAEWAWDPATYAPEAAARRALRSVAGRLADTLAPLVEAASSWPPSATRAPRIAWLVEETEGGDGAARHRLDAALGALVALPAELRDADAELVRELSPWIDAAAREAALARRVLAAADGAGGLSERDRELLAAERAALADHEPDVLRTLLGGFVDRTLTR